MIVDPRRTPVGVVTMLLLVTAASTGSYQYCVVAFAPPLTTRLQGRRVGAGATGGAATTATATTGLYAFPSDSVEPMTAAAQAQLQNEHFASSQTTSSVSQDSFATTIAPPAMARPATESKGNEHTLARVEQQRTEQIELQQQQQQEEEQVPVWERVKPIDIQGGSQRTWSFAQHSNMVEVHVRNPYGNVREND